MQKTAYFQIFSHTLSGLSIIFLISACLANCLPSGSSNVSDYKSYTMQASQNAPRSIGTANFNPYSDTPIQPKSTTITIQPGPTDGKDTTILTIDPNCNYGNENIWIGYYNDVSQPAGKERALFQFDLSSVPPNVGITDASFQLYLYAGSGMSTTPIDIEAHRITRNWVEGTRNAGTPTPADGATWNTYDGANYWSSPGGDFDSTVVWTTTVSGTGDAWFSWTITQLVRGWYSGSYPNYGVLLKGTSSVESSSTTNDKWFRASEWTADESLRPKLVITYVTDSTPPTTTHTLSGTVGNNGWYRSAVTVTLTATDAESSIAETKYRLDSGSWQTYTSPFVVSNDGIHTLEYYSKDTAGNQERSKTAEIKIDATPPTTTCSLTPASPGPTGWYNTDVWVGLNPADATSQVATTKYRLNGGSWQTYTGQFSISADGRHNVEFYSEDNAGNSEQPSSVTIQIDKNGPVTTYRYSGSPGENNWFVSPGVVSFSATDQGCGQVAKIEYKLDAGGWTEYTNPFPISNDGVHQLQFFATDALGNKESVQTVEIKLDTVAPATTLSSSKHNNDWYGSFEFQFSIVDLTSGGNYTKYQIDGSSWQICFPNEVVRIEGEGTHTIEFYSVDYAGNRETQHSETVKIDVTAPVTTLKGTPGKEGWYISHTFRFEVTDALSGVNVTYYRIDENVTWSLYGGSVTIPDGEHTIEFYSIDFAGNRESMKTESVRVDATPPETAPQISGLKGKNDWYRGADVTLSFIALDSVAGVASIEYRTADETDWHIYTGAITISTEGIFKYEYRAYDNAGNCEPQKNITLKLDHTAPVLHYSPIKKCTEGEPLEIVVNVTDNNRVTNVTLYFRIVDKSAKWHSVEMEKSGSNTYSYKIPAEYVTTKGLEYYVTAEDEAGNIGTKEGVSADKPHKVEVIAPFSLLWLALIPVAIVFILLLFLGLKRLRAAKERKGLPGSLRPLTPFPTLRLPAPQRVPPQAVPQLQPQLQPRPQPQLRPPPPLQLQPQVSPPEEEIVFLPPVQEMFASTKKPDLKSYLEKIPVEPEKTAQMELQEYLAQLDVDEELKKLEELHKKGLMTENEFLESKKRLLESVKK